VDEIYPHVDKSEDKPLIIKASAKDGTGIAEFEAAIKSLFLQGEIDNEEEVYITNLRHIEALFKACESMRQVRYSLNEKMPEDFLTIDMMNAYENLGKIIGEQVDEDLVNEIFARFCLGK
jgi:tRNA modification GTPase